MADYQLNFPVNAGNPRPLRDIASMVAEIGTRTKLTSGEMALFTGFLKRAQDSGLSYNRAINETIRQFSKMGGAAHSFGLELKDVIDIDNRAAAAAERASDRRIRAIEREAAAQSRAAEIRRA